MSTPKGKLALDRYVMGLWRDRELEEFVSNDPDAPSELAALLKQPTYERPSAAKRLRASWFGAEQLSEVDQLEALIREAIDVVQRGQTVLPQLQHDLGARLSSVPKDDARARAAMSLIQLAAQSQVQVHMKSVRSEPLAAPDRVSAAREKTLAELRGILKSMPQLLPT